MPPPVVAAFWALETDFGAVQGDFRTLDALATLSHDCRRPQLFRPQLMALLKLIDLGILPPDVKGAWAGEIGQTQILPKDYLEKGIDGDGDGKVDLRSSAPDVIMTTANFVKPARLAAGEPWLEEVRVPDDLPWEQTGRDEPPADRASGPPGASPTATARRSRIRACQAASCCRWAARVRPSWPTRTTTSISNGTSRSSTR